MGSISEKSRSSPGIVQDERVNDIISNNAVIILFVIVVMPPIYMLPHFAGKINKIFCEPALFSKFAKSGLKMQKTAKKPELILKEVFTFLKKYVIITVGVEKNAKNTSVILTKQYYNIFLRRKHHDRKKKSFYGW